MYVFSRILHVRHAILGTADRALLVVLNFHQAHRMNRCFACARPPDGTWFETNVAAWVVGRMLCLLLFLLALLLRRLRRRCQVPQVVLLVRLFCLMDHLRFLRIFADADLFHQAAIEQSVSCQESARRFARMAVILPEGFDQILTTHCWESAA